MNYKEEITNILTGTLDAIFDEFLNMELTSQDSSIKDLFKIKLEKLYEEEKNKLTDLIGNFFDLQKEANLKILEKAKEAFEIFRDGTAGIVRKHIDTLKNSSPESEFIIKAEFDELSRKIKVKIQKANEENEKAISEIYRETIEKSEVIIYGFQDRVIKILDALI